MTMRVDIMTNDAGELVRREHARDLGAGVLIAIYRLIKLAQLHDLTNQAFTRQLEQSHRLVVDYCLRSGINLTVLFAHKAVMIGGQLLKGNRSIYESALELAELFLHCNGGAELRIAKDVTQQELRSFAEAISLATRSKSGEFKFPAGGKIQLRPVSEAARVRGLELENLTVEQRIVRNYAYAIVILRRFFDDLKVGRNILPRRVKRVAQNLVDLSEGETPAFLGVTEMRNANHDDAGRAVNTSILAVGMARQVTEDRVALAQIAMSAMLHDVGRPRALRLALGAGAMSHVGVKLSESDEDNIPAGSAAVLTALGRINEGSIRRSVVTFEALWLRRTQYIGPLYRGIRGPTLQSKIITIARRYNDLLIPDPGLPAPPPDYAIGTLAQELKDPAERTILRLLVAALGIYPIGTIVQLSTGEVGEVIPSEPQAAAAGKPKLRVVMTASGGMAGRGAEIDLWMQDASKSPRQIVKVLDTEGWPKGAEPSEEGEGRPEMRTELDSEPPPPPPPPPPPGPSLQETWANQRAGRSVEPPESRRSCPPTVALPTGAKAKEALNFFEQDDVLDAPQAYDQYEQEEAPRYEVPLSGPAGAAIDRMARMAQSSPPVEPEEEEDDNEERTVCESSPFAEEEDDDDDDAKTVAFQAGSQQSQLVRNAMAARGVAGPNPGGMFPVRPSRDDAPASRRIPPSHPGFPPSSPRIQHGQIANLPPPQSNAGNLEDRPIDPGNLAPTAKGDLNATPVVSVLIYLLDRCFTGTVVFREPSELQHGIFFVNGAPAKARTGRPIALLGDEVIASNMASGEMVADALEEARGRRILLGQALLRRRVITSQELMVALQLQLARKVASLVNLPKETGYTFYRNTNLLEDWASPDLHHVNALNLILSCVRVWQDRDRIQTALARLGSQPLLLHPEADLDRFVFNREELEVVDLIREEGPSLPDLYDNPELAKHVIASVVYALAVTRHLLLKGQKAGPMMQGPRPTQSGPPSDRNGQVLSVPEPSSTGTGIRQSLSRSYADAEPASWPSNSVSSVWNPDPATGARLAFRRIGEHTPTPPVIRRSVPPPPPPAPPPSEPPPSMPSSSRDSSPRSGGYPPASIPRPSVANPPVSSPKPPATSPFPPSARTGFSHQPPPAEAPASSPRPAPVTNQAPVAQKQPIAPAVSRGPIAPHFPSDSDKSESGASDKELQAMTDFGKAETALARGDMATAEGLAKKAADADPDAGDYLALWAYAKAMRGKPSAAPEGISVLNQVIQKEATNDRAILYRARLHKRVSQNAQALKDFESVLLLNPTHREAASEARLLRTRLKK